MQHKFQENLEGDFIFLKKVSPSDASDIYNWRSGLSGRYLRQPEGYSIAKQEEWINKRDNNEINYVIYDKVTNEKVGMIAIYDVNEHDGIANIGRLLLAEKFLKKSVPYGLEALLLTYGYLFEKMKFRKMTGDILAKNVDMVKLQLFLGMKQEGFFKQHTIINGIAEDIHIMSIMREDFEKYKQKIKFLLKGFK